MKRLAIRFTVIFSITFCVILIACLLFDDRSDTPWSSYLLAGLAVAVPVAGVGMFINGIVPKDSPAQKQNTGVAPAQDGLDAPGPLEVLESSFKLPGGKVLLFSFILGIVAGVCWVIFSGWFAMFWARPGWPPGKLSVLVLMGGAFALSAAARIAAWQRSELARIPLLAIALSSTILFVSSSAVIVGGSYAMVSGLESHDAGKAGERERFSRGKPSLRGPVAATTPADMPPIDPALPLDPARIREANAMATRLGINLSHARVPERTDIYLEYFTHRYANGTMTREEFDTNMRALAEAVRLHLQSLSQPR